MNHAILGAIFHDYMDMKREAAKDHQDVPMMIFAAPNALDDNDEPIAALVIGDGGHSGLIGEALGELCTKLFIPHWTACCSDGYVAKASDFPELNDARPGDLQVLYEAGDPRVKEVLTITALDKDGDMYAASVTYWYDSDGDVWFDDIEVARNDDAVQTEGGVVEAMRAVTSLHGLSTAEVLAKIANRN